MAAIIGGIIMVAIGGLITIKGNALYEALGPIPWAEQHLGSEGGSRLMYKLIGIGMSVLGFLIATGLVKSIIISIASLLIPGLKQP